MGPLTQQSYPGSLIHPDKNNISPRIAMSWRPFSASSMVVRASYGIYYDTSIYQTIANQMAQQSPLSKSLQVANTPTTPLTLANGFIGDPNITATTFAVDPNFQHRIHPDLADIRPARPAFRAANGRDIRGNQGHALATGVSAEYLPHGSARSLPYVPIGIHVSNLQRQFDPARRDIPIAAPAAKRAHRGAAVHLTRNRSTMPHI